MERPRIFQKTVQRKKPIHQESLTQVPKAAEQIGSIGDVVPETMEVPQVGINDHVLDEPVTLQRLAPMLQTAQETVEVSEVGLLDVFTTFRRRSNARSRGHRSC